MPHRVQIAVLDEDLDAQAVRHGEDITTYLSVDTPVWAREAAVAHLIRAVQAAGGHKATVHLDRGQALLVALDSQRPRRRARPRLPVNPLSSALAVIAVPFVGALFVLNQPWVPTAAIEPTWPMSAHLTPPRVCTAPAVPAPPRDPPYVTTQPPASEHRPSSTTDLPRDVTPKLPRVPIPTDHPEMIPPAYLPDQAPQYKPTPPTRPAHPPSRRRHPPTPGDIPDLPHLDGSNDDPPPQDP